jgi:hypothetical protein
VGIDLSGPHVGRSLFCYLINSLKLIEQEFKFSSVAVSLIIRESALFGAPLKILFLVSKVNHSGNLSPLLSEEDKVKVLLS